jgi:hypothetical protein
MKLPGICTMKYSDTASAPMATTSVRYFSRSV